MRSEEGSVRGNNGAGGECKRYTEGSSKMEDGRCKRNIQKQ